MNESPFLPKMWRKIIPKSLKYLIATQKSVSEKQHSRSLQLHNLIRWFEPKQHTYIHSQMEHLCWVLINGRLVRRWCGRTERSQRRSMCFSSRWHAHEIKSEKEQTYSWLSQVTHNMCTSVFLFTVHTRSYSGVFEGHQTHGRYSSAFLQFQESVTETENSVLRHIKQTHVNTLTSQQRQSCRNDIFHQPSE